ncbi:DUF1080 domain-containing protein [Polaribacter sp. Q13]|uniref:3-keto-disaccharide hydrolase n=1 Tax=Polaribacter sp. Q13 TaxID=2806551 RepID=UPI00193AE078|nr:DUF1080 domain-containing protein [Polaribacter sp. Q13]QVY66025.1 DUF1080 domain-containing protein [Polaribacter sp. Q13]
MKKNIFYCLVFLLMVSCGKEEHKSVEKKASTEKDAEISLPFSTIELNDLAGFKATSSNWKIVGNAIADRNKEKTFTATEGVGILLNTPNKEAKGNIFSNFEHGDIELELDVMMPLGSNSGIYFQGRYEVQLFDSWGVTAPKYNDIGGIYQRWNKEAAKGKEGYEGHAPMVNASKAPGLWQHLKVIFHAPKFNSEGKKTKNAWFEEVLLNGVLLHKNVEVTGATRGGKAKEVATAPFMIQGDHGAVAFKNIKYKLYGNKKIGIKETTLKVYDNPDKSRGLKKYEERKLIQEIKVDSISPLVRFKPNVQHTLNYTGQFDIPTTGEYLFDVNVYGTAVLIIDNDTVVNTGGIGSGKVKLQKGIVNYTLLYNKPYPWGLQFDLYVEGPEIQRYSVLETSMAGINKNKTIKPIVIDATTENQIQRCFLFHKGTKRTHVITVGFIEKLNFAYDLSSASLLQVWGGDFLETTDMWHSRGKEQVGSPRGFIVSANGNIDFAVLENENQDWPSEINEETNFKQKGYKLDKNQIPEFLCSINDVEIADKIIASTKEKRAVERIIHIDGKSAIWHKIAVGESIEKLPNNIFIINSESYYVDFSGNNTLETITRSKGGKEELLVKIPAGKQTINYTIIW